MKEITLVLFWVSGVTALFMAAAAVMPVPIEVLMGVFITVGVTPLIISQG